MKPSIRFLILAVMPLLILCLGACAEPAPEVDEAPEVAEELAPDATSAAGYGYRNAVNPPDPGWTGPVFELSHDYPATDPGSCPHEVCGWLAETPNFDSTDWADWEDYLAAILAYVKKGQDLAPTGWNVEVDGETRWFHVPWMAFNNSSGREFIHGMTNERTSHPDDLLGTPHSLPNVPDSDASWETWAFGVYNPWGGYAFGRTWAADGTPMTVGNCEAEPWDGCLPAGLPFLEGTLVAKLLFTTATPDEVGYLENSPEWKANRHGEVGGCDREPKPVRLVQMDVAVVDHRSPTRWIYGTYGYNGTIEAEDPWDRMSPLGIQWGTDPGAFPGVDDKSAITIKETVLAPINIYEHFGCGGRLAGPVDNKLASCMSCHGNGFSHLPIDSTTTLAPASSANVPPLYGFDGECTEYNETNKNYFSNFIFPAKWEQYPASMSMDMSLQMLVAFSSYGVFAQNGKPNACVPPDSASAS